ncbi:hypothetical protein [Halalkalibacter urbisdiaboli]|uniref:hypothetical protein n=1 Tax=Halalkalibacter urbisdiaboli TaxID=1960589 RepID=UPI000B44E747|nr:hypothetical protein [Halalkalibacter urbisdiaboli]
MGTILIVVWLVIAAMAGKSQFADNQVNRGTYIFLSLFTVIASFYIHDHGAWEWYTNVLAQLFTPLTNVVIGK